MSASVAETFTEAPTFNKRELARSRNISLPTLDALIAKHGECFPVVERGTHGREWKFDPVAVSDFLAEQEAAGQAEAAAKQAAIAQLGLPLTSAGGDPIANLKPAERLAHVRALQAEDRLAIDRKFLVLTANVRAGLQTAIAEWNRAEFAAIRQTFRRLGVPDLTAREIETALRGARDEFLAKLPGLLSDQALGDLFADTGGT